MQVELNKVGVDNGKPIYKLRQRGPLAGPAGGPHWRGPAGGVRRPQKRACNGSFSKALSTSSCFSVDNVKRFDLRGPLAGPAGGARWPQKRAGKGYFSKALSTSSCLGVDKCETLLQAHWRGPLAGPAGGARWRGPLAGPAGGAQWWARQRVPPVGPASGAGAHQSINK